MEVVAEVVVVISVVVVVIVVVVSVVVAVVVVVVVERVVIVVNREVVLIVIDAIGFSVKLTLSSGTYSVISSESSFTLVTVLRIGLVRNSVVSSDPSFSTESVS